MGKFKKEKELARTVREELEQKEDRKNCIRNMNRLRKMW